jgi:hypothetical protein
MIRNCSTAALTFLLLTFFCRAQTTLGSWPPSPTHSATGLSGVHAKKALLHSFDSALTYNNDNASHIFKPQSAIGYAYDGLGNCTQIIQHRTDTSGAWSPQILQRNSFTGTQHDSTVVYIAYNGEWWTASYNILSYSGGKPAISDIMQFNGTTWDPYYRDSLSYDSSGRLSFTSRHRWISSPPEWVILSVTHFDYDSAGNKISELTERFTGVAWEPQDRLVYTYSSSGKLTVVDRETWDQTITAWVPETRIAHTYGAGVLLQSENSTWDGSTGSWTLSRKDEFISDESVTASEVRWPSFGQGTFTHKIDSSRGYVYDGSNWMQNTYVKVFYGQLTTGMEEMQRGASIRMFPNPASGLVHVSAANIIDITVLDLSGRKMLEKKEIENGSLDVSSLPAGLYLFCITHKQSGIVENKKLLIAR